MRKIYLRQTKEGFKKSFSMIQNRKVLPRRNQDQVLPAALRLLREGPVEEVGAAEAQVAAQVTEVETARSSKDGVVVIKLGSNPFILV